jgi:hypothetical protein
MLERASQVKSSEFARLPVINTSAPTKIADVIHRKLIETPPTGLSFKFLCIDAKGDMDAQLRL